MIDKKKAMEVLVENLRRIMADDGVTLAEFDLHQHAATLLDRVIATDPEAQRSECKDEACIDPTQCKAPYPIQLDRNRHTALFQMWMLAARGALPSDVTQFGLDQGYLLPPLPETVCPYTHSHTKSWCGYEECRES